MLTHFIIHYQQIMLIYIILVLSEKPISIGKLSSSQWQIGIFQNSNFCLTAQILLSVTNSVSCFPWSDELTLFIFDKMSGKNPSLNNQFVSHSPFCWRLCLRFTAKVNRRYRDFPHTSQWLLFVCLFFHLFFFQSMSLILSFYFPWNNNQIKIMTLKITKKKMSFYDKILNLYPSKPVINFWVK